MSLVEWTRRRTRLDPRALAVEMCSRRAPEGMVVQGTSAREGLSFSVILRPERTPHAGLLPIIATFCASEGTRKDTGMITWIRWPDEVVVGGLALAVTSVTRGASGSSPWAVLNFRFNLGSVGIPGSTSLRALLGVDVDPDMLVGKVLDSLAWMHSGWVKGMTTQVLARITWMLESPGERVAVEVEGRVVPGVARGVDEEGRLIVELDGTGARVAIEEKSRLRAP